MSPMIAKPVMRIGIIKSPETSAELYCALCDCETSFASCQQHAQSPAHRQREKRFFRVFETIGDRAKCQICTTYVDWTKARLHAEHHTLIPWSESPENYDRFKIFFDNAIIQWKDVFRCCLCYDTFAIWDLALVHVTNPQHRRLRHSDTSAMDSQPLVTDATWESLVRECLVPFDGSELRCIICENRSVPIGSVDRHIKGLLHLSSKSKFQLLFEDCEAVDSVATLFPQDWQSEEEQRRATDVDSGFVSSAETQFPEDRESKKEQRKAVDTACEIVRTAKTPLPENCWGKTEQSKAIDSTCMFVRTAEPPLPENHRSKTELSKTVETVRERPKQVEVRSIALDLDYILKEPNCTWYCVICDCPLKERSVSRHAAEKTHVFALKRYGCDAISCKGGVDYYCQYCDSAISSLDNVYQHVTGKKHQKSTKLALAKEVRTTYQRINKREETVVDRGAEATSDLDYMLRRNDGTAWYCVICSCRLDDRPMSNHTTEKSHEIYFKRFGCDAISLTRDSRYYCRYCDCNMTCNEGVYAHVVGKKHLVSLIALNTGEPKALALRLARMRSVS